jgi:hypothetical protein
MESSGLAFNHGAIGLLWQDHHHAFLIRWLVKLVHQRMVGRVDCQEGLWLVVTVPRLSDSTTMKRFVAIKCYDCDQWKNRNSVGCLLGRTLFTAD